MTPDYTDPHLKLTTALRDLIQEAKANGLSSTDATRQAEEALRGVEPDDAAKVAEKMVCVYGKYVCLNVGSSDTPLVPENRSKAVQVLAAALRDFASAEVAKARAEDSKDKQPHVEPPAVEGDDPFAGPIFESLCTAWRSSEHFLSKQREAYRSLQSYCRSAARAAEERGRREEREACARTAEAIDSGRGNEQMIASAIRRRAK